MQVSPQHNPHQLQAFWGQELLLGILSSFFLFVFCFLFRAVSTAYGSSQARGPIGVAYAGLHHSHRTWVIRAASATYNTAHSNTGYLTY